MESHSHEVNQTPGDGDVDGTTSNTAINSSAVEIPIHQDANNRDSQAQSPVHSGREAVDHTEIQFSNSLEGTVTLL
jgi:hypothetical protein